MRPEMNRQTSGCIRLVCSMNTPRSGGMASSSPSRCPSARAALPRMHRLRDLGQLLWITEEHQAPRRHRADHRVDKGELACLVDQQYVDGRGTQVLAGELPGGARYDVVVRADERLGRLHVLDSRQAAAGRLAAVPRCAQLDDSPAGEDLDDLR